MNGYTGNRVISGTWGQVWLEGELVAEITAFQAKITYNKEDVKRAGEMMVDQKVLSAKGAGSMTMNKINSRMVELLGGKILDGVDVRFTVVAKLDDPDAFGSEHIAFLNVSFDELTIMDWKHSTMGEITEPFTFTKYKPYNLISA